MGVCARGCGLGQRKRGRWDNSGRLGPYLTYLCLVCWLVCVCVCCKLVCFVRSLL